ncbi:MAG: nuclear transport factor 2 family protein [Gemmatimonadaceae bacterium]|nr:nuclear transport factor 2 family protein [Gemmatimonadaceae bacterium]
MHNVEGAEGRSPRTRCPIRSLAPLLLVMLATPAAAQSPPATDRGGVTVAAGVRAALDSFIVDFNNLDSARFTARWAEGASAVLPFPDTPHRLDGRDAVLARFMSYFAQMRRERSGPPFLFMVLHHVRIDTLGDDAALVASEFSAAERVHRRSLVMVRDDAGAWKVLQMHGSSGMP